MAKSFVKEEVADWILGYINRTFILIIEINLIILIDFQSYFKNKLSLNSRSALKQYEHVKFYFSYVYLLL